MIELPSPYDLAGMHRFMKRPDLPQVLIQLEIEDLRRELTRLKKTKRRKGKRK